MRRKLKVLAIPDIHAPFHNIKAIAQVYTAIEEEKPDVIIQLGDILDRFCFSRFGRSQDIMTPEEEITEGHQFCQLFWAQIHRLAPKSRKIQLLGNHCARLQRSVIDKYPEIYSIVKNADKDFFKFPNVQTVFDNRTELEIEGVVYTHGWYTKLGDHCKYLLKPVVHGHSHRGGSMFINIGGQTIWELDCGFLADEKQRALQYGATQTTHWTLGYGIIDKHGPRFIPLTNKK